MAYRARKVYTLTGVAPVTVAAPTWESAVSTLTVYLNGVLKTITTHYTYNSGTNQVTYTAANSNGDILSIIRSSDLDNRDVDYADAVDLTETDLDADSKQHHALIQELDDQIQDSLKLDPTVGFDFNAGNHQIKNVADGTDAQDAVTLAQLTANSVADQAYADAQDAIHSTADQAYADAQDVIHSTADKAYADTQDDVHSIADRAYADNAVAVVTAPIVTGMLREYLITTILGQTVVTFPVNFDQILLFKNGHQLNKVTDYNVTAANAVTLVVAAGAGDKILGVVGDLSLTITDADTLEGHAAAYFAIAGAAPAAHTHGGGDVTSAVASANNADTVDGVHAAGFAPSTHVGNTTGHPVAVASTSDGFLTGADKTKIDNLGTTYAPIAHVGNTTGHPDAVASTSSGFLSGADKTKIDNLGTTYAAASHNHTQAQSHDSPDTDNATTSLHHTLGTGANQAAAGNHTHAVASLTRDFVSTQLPLYSSSTLEILQTGLYCVVVSATADSATSQILVDGSNVHSIALDKMGTDVFFLNLTDGDLVGMQSLTLIGQHHLTGPF